MKNLMSKLKVLAFLIIALALIFCGIYFTFKTVFVNFLLIIIALFVFAQTLDIIDKNNGYNTELNQGDNTTTNNNNNNNTES